MLNFNENTIAAISTPRGTGGIAIIRLSGPKSISIADNIFTGRKRILNIEPWKATLGKIYDKDIFIDEVVVTVFKAPFSYTKEDMVEIGCHGGIYVSQRILELLVQHGAHLAEPGEFSFRAFMSGRLDLSQVEAVGSLIKAKTESSMQASLRQLDGALSKMINEIRTQLLDSCSLLELELDFPEEDVEFVSRSEFVELIEKIEGNLQGLIHSYEIGRIARDGVKVVIVGKPNVGKSSLLNKLLNEDRAIVTETPGTTRDVLEVQLDLKGVLYRVFDTAGITSTDDAIEKEGIIRAKKMVESADIVIHVFDGSKLIDEEDLHIIDNINSFRGKHIIRAINKSDLPAIIERTKISVDSISIIELSASTGAGLGHLEQKLIDSVFNLKDDIFNEEILITEVRHLNLLKQALESLEQAKIQAQKNVSSEFISLYLREALDKLGEIVGVVTSEDILNNIFLKFCVGK